MPSVEDGAPDHTATAGGVTVVVTADDAAGLPRCIHSLATQTLSTQQIDAVVILDSAVDGSAAVTAARSRYPHLRLRSITLTKWTVAAARQAGIAVARQPYITFVRSSDSLQRRFLEALLGAAGNETIAVARAIDVGAGNSEQHAEASVDGPRPDVVRSLQANDIPAALSADPAKLVPMSLAKHAIRDRANDHVADLAFWAGMYVRQAMSVQFVDGIDCAYEQDQAKQASELGTFDSEVTRRIARLELLEALIEEAVDDETRAVLDKWINDETSAIGRHLTDHSHDHPRTVLALDRSRLFRLPSKTLNMGMARGLVVSYCFPPYVDTAAVVAAKRVRERGEIVDVVYNVMDRIRGTDITTRRIAGPFIDDEAAVPSPTAFASWSSIESFREMGMTQILAWERQKSPYDSVYSRAQFAASHFLAAAYKLHRPSTRWTAEFSDPLSRDVQGELRGDPVDDGPLLEQLTKAFYASGVEPPNSKNAFLWCEWTAYVLADELLFTNRNQLEYMKRDCPALIADMIDRKAIIAPHPTLPPQFYNMVEHAYSLRKDVLNLAYFGNFYSTRGLDDVLLALAGLPPEIRRCVLLHVFTSRADELRQRTRQLRVTDFVLVREYVDFLHFLNLTTKFDCLIVNDAATAPDVENPYLPSKWSDYRGSPSPVWGLVEDGSPLSDMPLAFRSPIGHVSAAQQVIANLVAAKVTRRPVLQAEPLDILNI